MSDKKERITLFLFNMLSTIQTYCDKTKKQIYAINTLNNDLKQDIRLFLTRITQDKEKIDLEKNIRLLDIKKTDSIQDQLFEYRTFFINILPDQKQLLYRKEIIHHLTNFLLLIISIIPQIEGK